MPPRNMLSAWLSGHPRTALASLAGLVFAGAVISQSAEPTPLQIPTIQLSSTPLYLPGLKQKPTLTLALSVEYPTTGAAYRGTNDYRSTTEYVGYFDDKGCYSYSSSGGGFFVRESSTADRTCGNTHWSGNFLNWASTSSIDILRYSLTGGDRVTDTANTTVLQRAYLRDDYFKNGAYFPRKQMTAASLAGAMPSSLRGNGNVNITNCRNVIYFGSGDDGTACNDARQNANKIGRAHV